MFHILFVILCLLPFKAIADHSQYPRQFVSGNTLVNLLKEPETDFLSKGRVMGIVETVFDKEAYSRWNVIQNTKDEPQAKMPKMRRGIAEMFFCEPSGVTRGQLTAIVQKFLEQNPERWSQPAHQLVGEAFKKAFPCRAEDLFPDSQQ